jgi:molybdopterin-guanine dinucleotide biosynthesis protein A
MSLERYTGAIMIAGVFVGGAGRRMGGRAKGTMEAPGGGTIVDRWIALLRSVGVARILLVGRHPAYGGFDLETIDDEPGGIGPIGGLVALLRRATPGHALALACDMPYVSRALTARLIAAPGAPIVAPWLDGRWEPLFARYDADPVLPLARQQIVAARHSLQPLLERGGAVPLDLAPGEARELRDWDTIEDTF